MPIPTFAPAAVPDDELEAPLRPRTPASGKAARIDQIAQAVVLAMLFATPALMCVHAAGVSDPDFWWHLRSGQWILQHHAIPHSDTFSRFNAGKPWEAYSWLFEVLTFQLFQRLGPVGIVGYTAGMVLAITVALRHLVRRLQSDFTLEILLTFVGYFSLSHLFTPRPWLFTILFFVLEVDILMHARKTGRTRELVWLPVIFALWSNTHIQFVYGLAVLALALIEAVARRRNPGSGMRLRARWLFAAFAGSVVAAMANPFGWQIYRIVYNLAKEPGGLNLITELQAVAFRDIMDYCLLFLAFAAVAALTWSRRFQIFEVGLLIFAAFVSFRSQRDIWVMVTVATAIVASTLAGRQKATSQLPGFATVVAVIVAGIAMLTGFRVMQVNNQKLDAEIARKLPVHAVNEVRAKGYAGPLFNTFDWGGYLIWALRMPVSIDGRGAFYGDKSIDRSVATWTAQPDWASDPALTSAGLVIGPTESALTQVLRRDPKFNLVYEDKLATVFVARR